MYITYTLVTATIVNALTILDLPAAVERQRIIVEQVVEQAKDVLLTTTSDFMRFKLLKKIAEVEKVFLDLLDPLLDPNEPFTYIVRAQTAMELDDFDPRMSIRRKVEYFGDVMTIMKKNREKLCLRNFLPYTKIMKNLDIILLHLDISPQIKQMLLH
uniref:NR LBD domain-containing protein n=1 Tax=Clastoptera arizonana TaxID=38151 RepID=A0A1B6DZY6_9HEMI